MQSTQPENKSSEKTQYSFFHTENANRTVQAGPFSVMFAAYTHVGTWFGIYATKVKEEIEHLEALAADAKSAVTKIDETEFRKCLLQKKQDAVSSMDDSLLKSFVGLPKEIREIIPQTAEAPVEPELPSQPANDAAPLKTVEQAIDVGPVAQ